MFRAGAVCRAAFASHRPVLASSVSGRSVVKRLLGERGIPPLNVNALNSVITKTQGKGLAGTAGVLGRATFYVHRNNPEISINEIDKILPDIQDEDLRRHAIGIRLQARSDLLSIKEAGLQVDGGATALDVSTLRTALREDYEALKKASPGCWLVELAATEYSLYEGNASGAYKGFCDVMNKIKEFIASVERTPLSFETASPENTRLAMLLAFQLNRARVTEGVKYAASSIIEEGIKHILEYGSVKDSLQAFKKELGASLTDEEAIELAYVVEAAYIHHHFHDYFPLSGEYADWQSESAKKVKEEINCLYAPQSTGLQDEMLANVEKAVAPEAFYAPEDELRKFLSSSGHTNFLTELRERFGPGPRCVLAKADEPYFEAMKILEQAPASANTAGDPSYSLKQNEVSRRLAQQLFYRAKINAAVALTELDRLDEAMGLLDEVIAANEFIYMWRAYLARGEAKKRLGLISESDKDFRQLSGMKRSFSSNV